jgi:hypothetical protein
MTPEQSKALRGKMPDNLVSKFPANAGANANKEYAGHAAVTDRLLEVDPAWTWKFLGDGTPVFDDVGGIWIELTVCGVTRIGYGFPERLKGGNGIKEAIGDAIRNAAMRFGVGLEFWFKGDLFAEPDKGQELLSEAQLKELANALSLVASKPAAWDRIKPKFGTDNPQAFTTGQFADLMGFVGAMPKLTDKLPQAGKDEFLKRITETGRNPDEVLAALKFDKETLTYGQKSETAEYMAALKKQEKAA